MDKKMQLVILGFLGSALLPTKATEIGFRGAHAEASAGAAYRTSSGSSWSAGASLGGALSRHVLLLGRATYSRRGGERIDLGGGLVQGTAIARVGHGRILEGMGGVQIQYPIPETKLAPYGGFELGVVQSTFNAQVRVTGQPIGPPTLTVQQRFQQTSLAFSAPFGFRYYISEHWGVRPEVAAVWGRELTTFYRFSVGLFYQFGGRR